MMRMALTQYVRVYHVVYNVPWPWHCTILVRTSMVRTIQWGLIVKDILSVFPEMAKLLLLEVHGEKSGQMRVFTM